MRPWMLPIAVLVGCGTPWIEEIDGDLRRLTSTLKTNKSGNLTASVRPESGESAMLVTVAPVDSIQDVHIRYLQIGSEYPFRADVEVVSARARTNAGFLGRAVSLNWPIAEDDGLLQVGTPHKFQAGLVNTELLYESGTAQVSVVLKTDNDFSSGMLGVNVIFVGPTGSDPDLVDATEQAIERWRRIYEEIGITLDFSFFDFSGNGVLAAPGQGDDEAAYTEIAASAPFGNVNLVIVEDIAGFDQVFGFAGDIPGPLVPTGRSAVTINAGLGAGPDGVFSDGDIQLLAETMAHETGHFIGLFHPVETSYDSWDALADTPECPDEFGCAVALGTNVMYPFPICDAVSCVPQIDLSPQQGGVANRYVGVR